MTFDDFTTAVECAKNDIQRGDRAAVQLARLLCGRLRVSGVPAYVLNELKRELQDYNRQTCSWKEKL